MLDVMDERKQYLESHSTGIGGGDIAAVLDMNPWRKPIDVYLGKLGLEQKREKTEPMEWGSYMEEGIRRAYERTTGFKVMRPDLIANAFPECKPEKWEGGTMLRHPDVACILGSPDGIVLDAQRGFEAKTCGWKTDEWGKAGTDEVPAHYLLQCCQYMAITRIPVWDLAVLFRGNHMEIYTIHRDADVESAILDNGSQFWREHVMKQVPPRDDGSSNYGRYLAQKWRTGTAQWLTADTELEIIAKHYQATKQEIKKLEAAEQFDENQLMELIGENKGAVLSDKSKVQWIRSKPSDVVNYQALAMSFNPTPEQIATFTDKQQRAAFLRCYDAPKNGKQ